MHMSTRFLGTPAAIMAVIALSACGSNDETTMTDEDTAVADVDPGESGGTINDTTLIDGTIGAEEAMGMESRMPADSNGESQSAAPAAAEPEPETEPKPAREPAEEPDAEESTEESTPAPATDDGGEATE